MTFDENLIQALEEAFLTHDAKKCGVDCCILCYAQIMKEKEQGKENG